MTGDDERGPTTTTSAVVTEDEQDEPDMAESPKDDDEQDEPTMPTTAQDKDESPQDDQDEPTMATQTSASTPKDETTQSMETSEPNTNGKEGQEESSHLQFQYGQRVIFCRIAGKQWFEGRIEKTGQSECSVQMYEPSCDEKLTADGKEAVSKPGGIFEIPTSQIRPMPEERQLHKTPAMRTAPIFNDPYGHLYIEEDPDFIRLKQSMTKENIERMEFHIPNRQKYKSGSGLFAAQHTNTSKVISNALPTKDDLTNLRVRAEQDPTAMLKFADIINFGLHGAKSNEDDARIYYLCAAWGVSATDWEKKDWNADYDHVPYFYPMGTPEALCAAALSLWELLQRFSLGKFTTYKDVLREVRKTRDRDRTGLLHSIVMFLGHAYRREWLCPFSVEFGRALKDTELLSANIMFPHSLHLHYAIHVENVLCANQAQKYNLQEGTMLTEELSNKHSDPTEEMYDMFRPKATEIFLSLPVQPQKDRGYYAEHSPFVASTGRYRWHIHIEYRKMPFPPYKTFLLSFDPQVKLVTGEVQLAESLAYTPYSEEAFAFFWTRLAFGYHQGDKNGGERFRPPLITFVDRPGDRQLAEYIQAQIGTGSGTEIRLLESTDKFMVDVGKRQKRKLSFIVQEIIGREIRMADADKSTTLSVGETDYQGHVDKLPVEKLREHVVQLVDEGKNYLNLARWTPALKTFTAAIEMIQMTTHSDKEIYSLLGSLLSNRSQCLIKSAEGMSPLSAETWLKKAIHDCDVALNSAWSTCVPDDVQETLKKQKETATADKTRAVSLQDEATRKKTQLAGPEWNSESTLPLTNEAADPTASGPKPTSTALSKQGPNRRNTKKGGGKKQTKRQKQKQRKQRERLREMGEEEEEEGEPSVVEELDEREKALVFLLGGDVQGSANARYINGKEEPCPVCYDRFRVELSDVPVALFHCGHASCLPCMADLAEKGRVGGKKAPDSPPVLTCPVCREQLSERTLTLAVEPVVARVELMQTRLEALPINAHERLDVAKNLLLQKKFDIGVVVRVLDSMLTDNLQSSIRRSGTLTRLEKQKIYEEARRPVDALYFERDKLYRELRSIRDYESKDFIRIYKRIEKISYKLIPAAHERAQRKVFEQMNNVGSFGAENVLGEIEVDFHALHVNEAKDLFDESVVPVLQAVGAITIVVGRGHHSEGGVAKLKPALKKHIDKHPQSRHLRYKEIEGNEGAILVEWKKARRH